MDIIPHLIDCSSQEYYANNTQTDNEWLFLANSILYYVYPCVPAIGVFFSLLNSIVTAKMVEDSHECYLTGLNIASFLMLLTVCVTQIPHYFITPGDSVYSVVLPYLPAVENWCWYSTTWLLLAAVAERMGLAMCGRWHASFGRIHGILVSMLMIVICFVMTLPQYWEFTAREITDARNCSRLIITSRQSVLTSTSNAYLPEYTYYHWFLLIFSMGLPYLLLPIMLAPMCCVKMHTYSALNGGSTKYDLDLKDQRRNDRSFNRLIIVMVTLYLLMAGPRCAFRLLHNPPISTDFCDSELFSSTLSIIFDAWFYLFFIVLFFLNMCISAKFRDTLRYCCRKGDRNSYAY